MDRVEAGYRLALPEEFHYNHWIADRSIAFLERTDTRPFFLFCSFPDPHHPFAACRPYSEMYDPVVVLLPPHWRERVEPCRFLNAMHAMRNGYNRCPDEAELCEVIAQTFGLISHVDACIGRIMQTLRATGLDGNTLVVFLADHGEYLGNHNLLLKGSWPYEELMRVPFVWRVPGGSPVHTVDAPVSLLDVAPTLAEYAGVQYNPQDRLRGAMKLIRPALPGHILRPWPDTGCGEVSTPIFEYDEEGGAQTPVCRQRGLVNGNWKLVIWGGFDDGILFNLVDDPCEQTNLWDEPSAQPTKAALLARLVNRLACTERFDTPRLCPVYLEVALNTTPSSAVIALDQPRLRSNRLFLRRFGSLHPSTIPHTPSRSGG